MLDQFMPPGYLVHNGRVYRRLEVEVDTAQGPKTIEEHDLVCATELLVTGASQDYEGARFSVQVRDEFTRFRAYTLPIDVLTADPSDGGFENALAEIGLPSAPRMVERLRAYLVDCVHMYAVRATRH